MFKAIQKIDWRIMHYIDRRKRNKFFLKAMQVLSIIGNAGTVWFVLIGVLFLFQLHLRAATSMLMSLTLSLLVGNVVLKNLIQRERPFVQDSNIENLIPPPTDHSCPSGHAYSSFSASVALVCIVGWIGTPALLLAAAIAYSRIYLCVHFPSDIFTSLLLGTGTGILSALIL